MANNLKFDENDIHTYENQETKDKLPMGWLILFVGLIVFGLVYTYSYTPAFSGWSQSKAYEETVKPMK